MNWKTLLIPTCGTLFFVSCNQLKQPLSGDFNPLSSPGAVRGATSTSSSSAPTPVFSKGQFVYAISSSTAFFKSKPSGNADADRLLSSGTSMRVVSTSGSYLKVELDGGDVGYVPAVMVSDSKNGGSSSGGAVQVYPPVGSSDALPLPGQGNIPSDVQANSSPVPPVDLMPVPPTDVPVVPEATTPAPMPTPSTTATPVVPEAARKASSELPPSSVSGNEQIPSMPASGSTATPTPPPTETLPTPAAEKTKEELEKAAAEKLKKAAQ